MSYQPATFNYATSDDTMSYFYEVDTDRFVSKIKWLDQNRTVDQIIVDATATAQDIDAIFNELYNTTEA
jgi:RNA processing factor Prp31|tara:strand:- start:1279 stop:1485 length:207 start_codon:yes stop_codon:yes gene_type:complete